MGHRTILVALLLAGGAAAQDRPPDPMAVEKAIDKGADFLKRRSGIGPYTPWTDQSDLGYEELVLYTLLHAGVNRDDPVVKGHLQTVLSRPLKRTYAAAVGAMALEAFDAAKHYNRLADCAQFLVDNQCANGQWGYGKETDLPKRPDQGTAVKARITRAAKNNVGGPSGDNSNTQYAALGLRACVKAGIEVPPETFSLALEWWVRSQNKDGGWGYMQNGMMGDQSTGTMTAGGVGSVSLLRQWGKVRPAPKEAPEDVKKATAEDAVKKGLAWLDANWSVEKSPKVADADPRRWLFYWLYGVERVGGLARIESIGKHAWYREGANWLIANQGADGSWTSRRENTVEDTCWAILFLRRATRPREKVASGDRKPGDKPPDDR